MLTLVSLVDRTWGVSIFTAADAVSFCCGPLNSSNTSTCSSATRGSIAPFPLQAGRVIFNRTSGSISPNSSDTATTATVELTSTAVISSAASSTTATPSQDLTTCPTLSCPSHKSTAVGAAVGAGVGVPLGIALLGALGLLWRQRSRERSARAEAHAWEEKYDELRSEQRGESSIGVAKRMQELEHEDGNPDELDGRFVYEIAGKRVWA